MKIVIKNPIFYNFQLVLLSLLPAALVAGPLIAEIIINIIAIAFVIDLLKNKNFQVLKNFIFLFFLIFYLIQIISLINSEIFSKSALNVFSYIRFILFAFGACEIVKKNEINLKFFYYFLSFTIFIVVCDGYFQYFNGQNILGFPKYRPDRISGFFNDNLILGSYLTRIIPILIGLTLFFKFKTKNIFYFNLLLILASTLLIFLSGERASFLLMIIFMIIIGFLIEIKIKIKLFISAIIISSIALILIFNPTMYDRHITQFKNHLYKPENKTVLIEYLPMFRTSIKMFKENPIIGLGPKSYRYYCDKKDYVNYYSFKPKTIDNTVIEIYFGWKEIRHIIIDKIYVKEGDIIDKGDKLFSYHFLTDDKQKDFFSKKEGRILEINHRNNQNEGTSYINMDWFAKIEPLRSPKKINTFVNACNTHPHNTYIQLLAETGIIGFTLIFSLFVLILYNIAKHAFNLLFLGKRNFSDLEICLLANFFIILWPLITTGNFFNNWLNIISFFPISIYLYIKQTKNEKRE